MSTRHRVGGRPSCGGEYTRRQTSFWSLTTKSSGTNTKGLSCSNDSAGNQGKIQRWKDELLHPSDLRILWADEKMKRTSGMQCTWGGGCWRGGCRGVSGSTGQGTSGRGHGEGYWGLQRHTFLYSFPSVWCQVGTGSPELSFQTPTTTAFCSHQDLSSRHPLLDGLQAVAVACGAARAGTSSNLGCLHLASISQTRAVHFSGAWLGNSCWAWCWMLWRGGTRAG